MKQFLKGYNMLVQFNFKIPHDFLLICLVFTLNPEDVLQDYIGRISLPRLLSGHPDDPLGEDMRLILHRTENQDPKRIGKHLLRFLESSWQEDIKPVLELELEQPECESKLREVLNNWRPNFMQFRIAIREKFGLKFKIVGYDS